MALGWGKVTPQEWAAAKSAGFGSDDVPAGEYVVKITEYRHIDPAKNSKGIGTHIVVGHTTVEGNAPEWSGKKLEMTFSYHPTSTAANYIQMGQIAMQNAIKLIEACNVEATTDSNGYLDVAATLKMLPTMEPVVVVSVSKEVKDGKPRQDVGNPRQVV